MGANYRQGKPARIQVRGPSVCSGYFDDPEATERKLATAGSETGDFACRDDEGYLWIKGALASS